MTNDTTPTTRETRVAQVLAAIRDGRAWLGERRVTAYDDSTGWAVTGNGDPWSRRSYMVTLERIDVR